MNEKLRVIIDNKQNVMKIPTGVRMLVRRCCKAVLANEGFTDIAEISVAKPRKLGNYQLMTAQNPVFIFTLQNGAKA